MLEKTINTYFAGHNEVAAVFIYGSHAGGQARTDSELDVVILMANYDPDSASVPHEPYTWRSCKG